MKAHTILRRLGILAAAALVVAGCALGTGPSTGAIRFSFAPASRSLSAGQAYRVEIYYGEDLYASEQTESDTIVFEAVPTGAATVYVAQGSVAGGSFVAQKSGTFQITIVPGDNSPAAITLEAVPLAAAPDLGGVGVSSVVTLGGTAYIATAGGALKSTSYAAGTGFSAVADGPAVPAGMSRVSVSVGKYFAGASDYASQIWVNGTWKADGTGGILPWGETGLDSGFVAGFGLGTNWAGGTPSDFTVLRSGAFAMPNGADPQTDGLAIFYQRNGGFGGVYVTRAEKDAQAEWPWITNQIDLSAALGGLGSDQEPVLDFVMGPTGAYLVTAFTTMKVASDALGAGLDAQSLLESRYVAFATGVTSPIISLAVDEANHKVYLGTRNGLWSGDTSESTAEFFTGTPAPVEGTSGYAVTKIALSPDGLHAAFVSTREGSPDYLVVLHTETLASTVYRTLDGLPGSTLNTLAWLDNGTLLVGGNAGLAALDVGN